VPSFSRAFSLTGLQLNLAVNPSFSGSGDFQSLYAVLDPRGLMGPILAQRESIELPPTIPIVNVPITGV
jgi:hypothetical protein